MRTKQVKEDVEHHTIRRWLLLVCTPGKKNNKWYPLNNSVVSPRQQWDHMETRFVLLKCFYWKYMPSLSHNHLGIQKRFQTPWHNTKVNMNSNISHFVSIFISPKECYEYLNYSKEELILKGTVHPKKNKKWLKCTHPQAIPDVDEFVSLSEQIWKHFAKLHHLLTNGSSAVNGCHQNESTNSW